MTATNPPAVYDITIYQGATWRLEVLYSYGLDLASVAPVNLSGYSARMQIRATRGNGVTQQAPFDSLLGELSTSNGAITLNADATTGLIRLSQSAAQTALLQVVPARYDLELVQTSSGDVIRLMMGDVVISEEVTLSG